jgi:hypothetical protein
MDEELVVAANNGAFRQAIVASREPHSVARRLSVAQK